MTQIMNRPPPGESPNNNNPSTLNVMSEPKTGDVNIFRVFAKNLKFYCQQIRRKH